MSAPKRFVYSELAREIQFQPAYDKRPKYGIHGVNMRWLLKGPRGVIQFMVYTNWQLPHVSEEFKAKFGRYPYDSPTLFLPMAADLGYHSPKPMYEGQDPIGECDVLAEGSQCYYDGSTLNAEPVFDLLVSEGGEAVWKRLEQEYKERFENVE